MGERGRDMKEDMKGEEQEEKKEKKTYHLLIWDPCTSVNFSEMA
jgi:hypothetical protein